MVPFWRGEYPAAALSMTWVAAGFWATSCNLPAGCARSLMVVKNGCNAEHFLGRGVGFRNLAIPRAAGNYSQPATCCSIAPLVVEASRDQLGDWQVLASVRSQRRVAPVVCSLGAGGPTWPTARLPSRRYYTTIRAACPALHRHRRARSSTCSHGLTAGERRLGIILNELADSALSHLVSAELRGQLLLPRLAAGEACPACGCNGCAAVICCK